jgi:hypothetical protein
LSLLTGIIIFPSAGTIPPIPQRAKMNLCIGQQTFTILATILINSIIMQSSTSSSSPPPAAVEAKVVAETKNEHPPPTYILNEKLDVVHRETGAIVCPALSSPDEIIVTDPSMIPSEVDKLPTRLIDGTTIRLFWHEGEWHMATRRKADASHAYWHGRRSFKELFFDCAENDPFWPGLDSLDKEKAHFYVIQHPDHRNVSPCIQERVVPLDGEVVSQNEMNRILTSTDLCDVGVFLNGCKYINGNWESARILKGNQPKMLYRCLELVMTKNRTDLQKFLEFFPEYTMTVERIEEYMYRLIGNVWDVYYHKYIVGRGKVFIRYDFRIKYFLEQVHNYYIAQKAKENPRRRRGRGRKFVVNIGTVKRTIDNCPIPKLYSLIKDFICPK